MGGRMRDTEAVGSRDHIMWLQLSEHALDSRMQSYWQSFLRFDYFADFILCE